jgi:hypothetical protein
MLVAAALAALLATAGAHAQPPLTAPSRAVRLEGYWDRTRSGDAEVIGDVVISTDGRDKRTFGVTAAQAYQPPEEGVQIFRHSALQPVTLLLRGRHETVERFLSAGPNEKVVALGHYVPGASQLVLGSVELRETPSAGALD